MPDVPFRLPASQLEYTQPPCIRTSALEFSEGGRVAQPFGFALTDPYVRLSRIRLFPKVTPKRTSRHTGMGDPRGGQRKELEHGTVSVPAHPTLAPALQGAEPRAPHLLIERLQATEVARQTVVLVVPPQHLAEPLVLIGHATCIRRRASVRSDFSLAVSRLLCVFRFTTKRPSRVQPQ